MSPEPQGQPRCSGSWGANAAVRSKIKLRLGGAAPTLKTRGATHATSIAVCARAYCVGGCPTCRVKATLNVLAEL